MIHTLKSPIIPGQSMVDLKERMSRDAVGLICNHFDLIFPSANLRIHDFHQLIDIKNSWYESTAVADVKELKLCFVAAWKDFVNARIDDLVIGHHANHPGERYLYCPSVDLGPIDILIPDSVNAINWIFHNYPISTGDNDINCYWKRAS